MADTHEYLGSLEEAILLSVQSLHDEAYVARIQEVLEEGNRKVSIGALYTTLERLETKGFVTSKKGDATQERGGRAKKFFKITGAGAHALHECSMSRQTIRAFGMGGVI